MEAREITATTLIGKDGRALELLAICSTRSTRVLEQMEFYKTEGQKRKFHVRDMVLVVHGSSLNKTTKWRAF